MNQKGKEKTVRNNIGFKCAKLLPAAASFKSLVHFRPHTFHFIFDTHDTHSLRYDTMKNYLNLTIYLLVTALDSSNHITLTDNCLYLISCLTNSSLITSYATLSNGVPRNIPRVNCIFTVNTQDFNSYQTIKNTATIAMSVRRGGWIRVRLTVFLFSDWMCFLWHGINSYFLITAIIELLPCFSFSHCLWQSYLKGKSLTNVLILISFCQKMHWYC